MKVIPEVGKTYKIKHSRKGEFTAEIMSVGSTYADIAIVDGTPKMLATRGGVGQGDVIRVSLDMCTFHAPDRLWDKP